MGMRVIVYINDGTILARDWAKANYYSALVREALKADGFVTSPEKCSWEPKQACQWLGFRGTIAVPQESLRDFLMEARAVRTLQARTIASIVGRIISMGTNIGPIARL